MKKFFALFIFTPYLFSHDYLMQIPRDLQIMILESVVHEKDFNKAFSNFQSLKRINQKFKELTEERSIKNQIFSAAVHGDLHTNIANITQLSAHKSFDCIDAKDVFIQELITLNLTPKVACLFSPFPSSIPVIPNHPPYITASEGTKLFAFISASILGTTTIMNSLTEQLKIDFKPMEHLCYLIYHQKDKNWYVSVPVYLRILESIKRINILKIDRCILLISQLVLQKAVASHDHLIIGSILKANPDLEITNPLWDCIQNGKKDWKKASDTIKLLLSFSNRLHADRIIYTLFELKTENDLTRFSEDDLQDIQEIMDTIKDIDYEKRHAKKIKLA